MVARGQFARLVAVCVLVAQAVLAPVAGVTLASGRDTAGRAPSSLLAPGSASIPPIPVPPGTAGILPAPVVSTGSDRAYAIRPYDQPASGRPDAVRPATLPAASSKPPHRPALTLASMPAHPVALRIGQAVGTLSRPVGDGAITFSLRRPTTTGALYSCTPAHGRCAMA